MLARAVDPRTLSASEFRTLVETVDILMRGGTIVDLAALRTGTLVRLISRASREQLAVVMDEPHLRGRVTAEILRRLPEHLNAERAARVDLTMRVRLSGGADPDGYDRVQIAVSRGTCTIAPERSEQADVTVSLAPADFLKLATSPVSAPKLIAARRLSVRGDLRLALKMLRCFDIPRE
jgi:putative sterol carrier protein